MHDKGGLRFYTLQELPDAPFLGEIAFAMRHSAAKLGFKAAYRQFEPAFGHRADFQCLLKLHFASDTGAYADGIKTAASILRNQGGHVGWGIFGVAGKFLFSRSAELDKQRINQSQLRLLADAVKSFTDEVALSATPRGCAFLRILGFAAVGSTTRSNLVQNSQRSPARATKLLNEFERLLRFIYPDWNPGDSMSLSSLQQERIIIPYAKTVQDGLLGNVFNYMRSLARQLDLNCKEPSLGGLRQRALKYARSAWLTRYSERKGDEQLISEYSSQKTKLRGRLAAMGQTIAFVREMYALHEYSRSAFDASESLMGAALSFIFLHLFNQRLPGIERLLSEASIPETVPENERIQKRVAEELETLKRIANGKRFTVYQCGFIAEETSFILRPRGSIGKVVRDWIENKAVSPDILCSSYWDALYLWRLEDANWLLKTKQRGQGTKRADSGERHGWQLSKKDVLQFAGQITAAAAIMPLAVDHNRHCHWRDRLARAWTSLAGEESFAPEEVLEIHGALLGGMTMATLSHACAAREIIQMQYELLSDRYIASSLEKMGIRANSLEFQSNSVPLFSILSKERIPSWETTAAVSIAFMRDGKASILGAVKGNIRMISGVPIEQAGNIEDETRNLLRDPSQLGLIARSGINWQSAPSCVRLIEKLCEVVGNNERPRWLMLAVEPEVASIPWNRAVREVGGLKNVIISVVPSLGWSHRTAFRRRSVPPRFARFVRSTREDLLKRLPINHRENALTLLEMFDSDGQRLAAHKCGLTFILGHGAFDSQTKIFTTEGPDGLITIGSWLDLFRNRGAIIHSCMTGRIEDRFVGDMSGIPGIGLQIGCKLIACPVVSIAPETAIAVQRAFTRAGSFTAAERYLDAVRNDRNAELYNLYGFADELIAL